MIASVLSRSKTSDSNSEHERDEARTLPLAKVRCHIVVTTQQGGRGLGSLPECPARRTAMQWRMRVQS